MHKVLNIKSYWMRKFIASFLAFMLCAFFAHATYTSENGVRKRVKNIDKRIIALPKIKVEIKIAPMEISELPDVGERYLDLDEDSGEDGAIPADDLYAIWDNLKVNPYKIPSDSIMINDSVRLDLTGFRYPLAKHYRVTSEFGPRRSRFHHGIDLKVYKGDSILNVMDGMVRIAKRVGSYGNLVVVRHNNGLESFY